MNSDSMVLIDETVLADVGAHWHAMQWDLAMMCQGAQERTKAQWEALLDQAGLRIASIHRYTATIADSIITAVQR